MQSLAERCVRMYAHPSLILICVPVLTMFWCESHRKQKGWDYGLQPHRDLILRITNFTILSVND